MDEKDSTGSDHMTSGKRLVADWVLGLGEPATQLEVIHGKAEEEASCKIVVLGSRNVFILHHTGVLIFSKKMDFLPITILSYPSGEFLWKSGAVNKLSAFFSQ